MLFASSAVRAQSERTVSSADLDAAKDLFLKGVTLFNAGDMERALDHFLRSRAAFASSKNTINAAICLDRLGRFDEALELYEEAITRFAAQLDASDKATIAPTMAKLRTKVGSLDISANVEGALVIDGRARGKLPLTTPVRLLAGTHVVRVLKDGYATYEGNATVVVGETVKVDAKLKPLAEAGQLRVEDPPNEGAEVYVDRVAVGQAPWEGTLGPGKHLVWTLKRDVGSAPTLAVVVQGQTALVRVRSSALGPATRIEVAPPTADVILDTVPLGAGRWEGRLPQGPHSVVANEPGYRSKTTPFVVLASDAAPVALKVALEIDPNHPRWPKTAKASGELRAEAFGGPALGSLGSDPEAKCPDACTGSSRAGGLIAGLRGAYRFRIGLSLELGGGVMLLQSTFARTASSTYSVEPNTYTATYELHHEIHVDGPFVEGGLSQHLALGRRFGLLGRAAFGALLASARDPVRATASTGGESVPATIEKSGDSARGVAAYVRPEVGGDVRFGRLQLGLSLSLAYFLTDGPSLPNGAIKVPITGCTPANPGDVHCAKDAPLTANEHPWTRALLWMPQLTAGYTF
jgi:hypothetical protein